ncbi:riboflavin biosynthesis protein RibF [Rickettsiales bacterium LUAb2]
MQTIFINNVKDANRVLKQGVFAIGNFDGVHKGHQELLKQTKAIAANLKVSNNWGVITFSPNTKLWLSDQHKNYEILTNDQQKIDLLEKYNVPTLIIIDFPAVYMLAAEEFFKQYMINLLDIKAIVTGEQAKLGKDLVLIKDLAVKYNVIYNEVNLVGNETNNYSSSLIKNLLQQGKIKEANTILDYSFSVIGKVVHGNKLGRKLGFPTANIIIKPYVSLKYGIYVTKLLRLKTNTWYNSVSNFGVRPTISNSNMQELLEVNIFDFNQEIYDEEVKVEFIDYLRSEEKFENLDVMIEQIKQDVATAKNILHHK